MERALLQSHGMVHITVRTVYACTFQTVLEGARDTAQWESICGPSSHPSFYLQQFEKQNRTEQNKTKSFLSEVTDCATEPTSGKPLQLGAGILPNHLKRAESSDFILTPEHLSSGITVFGMESFYVEHIYLESRGSSNPAV